MEFWMALGAAVLSAASILLHVIAPRTKTQLDDKIVKYIDDAIGKVKS